MSSLEMASPNTETKELSEFTFTWSIHNFSFCNWEENNSFVSPEFVIQFLEYKIWWLELYPRGLGAHGFISCYLKHMYRTNNTIKSKFEFTLSILRSAAPITEGSAKIFDYCVRENGYRKLISLEELKGLKNGYLANDKLTLRLHAWKKNTDNPTSTKSYAHSQVKAKKLDYTWILNDFEVSDEAFVFKSDQKAHITEFFFDGLGSPNVEIHIVDKCFLGLDKDAISFGLKMQDMGKDYFWVCRIHVLGANGKKVHSAHGEHLFKSDDEEEFWVFQIISKQKLCNDADLYLSRGKLTLQCDIGFSTVSKLKTFKYQTTDDLELNPGAVNHVPDPHERWIENLRRFYPTEKFSDFVIRTPDKQFPVHRAFLSAQSEVFTSMFERDMKENTIGQVEINDLDNDTISKMLVFLYTATMHDMDFSSAQKLYYAADKYGIEALQEKCSRKLVQCMNTSNVCDILDLADMHHDQELKTHARNFIDIHSQVVVNSESWKKLMTTNGHLTLEILQWMFCKKISDQKE